MNIERFRESPMGHLLPISGTDGRTGEEYDYFAFEPRPLNGAPVLGSGTWDAVVRASHALGRLQQGSQLVPNPSLLRRPTLRREAQSTSALEGTFAPLEDVLAADVIDDAERSSALSEVLNYVSAAELAFDWLADGRAITVGMVCELHRILVRGTAADTAEAGRVRRIQVAIGSRTGSIFDARFVPMPSGPALDAKYTDLLKWIDPANHPSTNAIVAVAMGHYQFETLHPYNDGNGRLGRLLIVLQLITEGLLSEGLLSVSPWFEARREQYQNLLAEVSASGDWDQWVTFFANGIEASSTDTATRLESLLALQSEYQSAIRASGGKGVIRDIADILIGNPYVTVPWLARTTGKTYQATSTALSRLVELGVLREVSSGYPKVFRADAVVEVTSRTVAVRT